MNQTYLSEFTVVIQPFDYLSKQHLSMTVWLPLLSVQPAATLGLLSRSGYQITLCDKLPIFRNYLKISRIILFLIP